MLSDIGSFETGEAAHSDVVKLREQKCINKMPAIDGKLWIVNRLLGDLESRRARPQEAATPPPIHFHFRFASARDQVGQIGPKQIMTFDDIGIAFFDDRRQTL